MKPLTCIRNLLKSKAPSRESWNTGRPCFLSWVKAAEIASITKNNEKWFPRIFSILASWSTYSFSNIGIGLHMENSARLCIPDRMSPLPRYLWDVTATNNAATPSGKIGKKNRRLYFRHQIFLNIYDNRHSNKKFFDPLSEYDQVTKAEINCLSDKVGRVSPTTPWLTV